MSRDDLRRAAELDELPPLGDPPASLTPEVRAAWFEIRATAPDVLRESDSVCVELAAHALVRARELLRSGVARPDWIGWVRNAYRILGEMFVPMAARRALIFGRRH